MYYLYILYYVITVLKLNMTKNNNLSIIFGIHSLIEAIKSGVKIEKIFIKKETNKLVFNNIISLANENNIPINRISINKFKNLSKKNHQGVFAKISPIEFYKIENLLPTIYKKNNPIIIILDRITDVRNFGSIIRSSVSMGANAIIIPNKNSACINHDLVKTSSGKIFNIPICKEKNLYKTVNYLKLYGIKIISATEKGKDIINNEDLSVPIAIILGNENKGISKNLLRISNKNLRIPCKYDFDTLNVSVSCGIILYEIIRQRKIL